MGKWNNAQFLCSDETVGLAHNLLADYQSRDFATFRSRLLELVNKQTKIADILDETTPYFQDIQDDLGELKEVYEQLAASYQEDKYPSIILSDEELARLADAIIEKFDASIKDNSLDGVLSKIKELTKKKEAPPVRTEVPNYSQRLNQLLTVMNNIQEQNRELMEKMDTIQNRDASEGEDDVLQIQSNNQSLLQALNKYKAAYITLKNERNDLATQLDKLKKENFLRIRRKELQDKLLAQKENEISALKEELARLKGDAAQTANPMKAAPSQPANQAAASRMENKAKSVNKNTATRPANKIAAVKAADKNESSESTAKETGSSQPVNKETDQPSNKTRASKQTPKANASDPAKEGDVSQSEKQAANANLGKAKKRLS